MTKISTTPTHKTFSVRNGKKNKTGRKKKEMKFPIDLHINIREDQYKFISRHGVFSRSRNIRFLIDQAMKKENKHIQENTMYFSTKAPEGRTKNISIYNPH